MFAKLSAEKGSLDHFHSIEKTKSNRKEEIEVGFYL